jgi:hypothetical protein
MLDSTDGIVYEDDIGQADSNGRLDAGRHEIDMNGGRLGLSGLRYGTGTMLGARIIGKAKYTRHVHGPLLFVVNIMTGQGPSTTDEDSTTIQKAKPSHTVASEASYLPFGIGGSFTGSRTTPGDVRSDMQAQGVSTPQIVAIGLDLQQVGVPR